MFGHKALNYKISYLESRVLTLEKERWEMYYKHKRLLEKLGFIEGRQLERTVLYTEQEYKNRKNGL